MFKNCVPFAECISEITNTQIDDAKYIDVKMSMNNWLYWKHQEVCDNITEMIQIII